MTHSPTPRRSTRASRLGLAAATLAAAGTFAAAIAVAGLPGAPVADASASAPTSTEVVTNPTTGERVVLDTVYIVTPAPAPAAAPAAAPAQYREGDEGPETEGGDD